MTITKFRTKSLLYGLCLAATLYNCKTKDANSPTPITYSFKQFDNIKLPDLKLTTPAAVTVVASTFTPSALSKEVSDALVNIASTGQVPAVVQQASADMGKAISAEKAAQIVASFTPDVINNFSATGKLPADLQTDLNSIASNPAVKAYLPTYTLPQVNGKSISGRLPAVSQTVAAAVAAKATLDDDACEVAASDAYNKKIAELDAEKKTQTDAVDKAFDQNKAAIQADATACKSGVSETYNAYEDAAEKQLTKDLALLSAAKTVLGETLYNFLVSLYVVVYNQYITILSILEKADEKACTAVAEAKLANAQVAHDTDYNTINTNYNTAVADAKKALDQAIASCHNQGQGG